MPPVRPVLQALADNWWLIFLRGAAAIIFGILSMIWPGISLVTLILLYGIFALADGILAIVAAIRGGSQGSRWWLALVGVIGIAAGVVTLSWPGISGIVLLFCIAAWAVVTGVMQVVGAFVARHEIEGEWWLIAGGVLSVLFGLLLFMRPGTGALALVLLIASYAILYGAILVAFSLRLRRRAHAFKHEGKPT